MDLEAVVLTGGASRRMGQDKSEMEIDGERMVDRMYRLLETVAVRVTILGPQGQPDHQPFAGPLAALADFEPRCDYVFVASCDMPLFPPEVVPALWRSCAGHDAAMPEVAGRTQPLCAVYRDYALDRARELAGAGLDRIMGWVDTLEVRLLNESELLALGVDPTRLRSANTPEAWAALLEERRIQSG